MYDAQEIFTDSDGNLSGWNNYFNFAERKATLSNCENNCTKTRKNVPVKLKMDSAYEYPYKKHIHQCRSTKKIMHMD
jgi:hypothetical protein